MTDLRHPRAVTRHHRERVLANHRHVIETFGGDLPLRDQSPLGCGNPRCGICHPDKRWKPPRDTRWRRDWDVS